MAIVIWRKSFKRAWKEWRDLIFANLTLWSSMYFLRYPKLNIISVNERFASLYFTNEFATSREKQRSVSSLVEIAP
jgi:hypothetical protein